MNIVNIFEEECEINYWTDFKVDIEEENNNFVFSVIRYDEVRDKIYLSAENTKKLVEVLSKKLQELED